ncbi:penicillin acylase family protein [Pusillimonas sp. CC-YST705]|uniref:Penicillin acylase family protein n=1 Tax=Mesopusillimonas faecipullorum TaxID=2755040 RepID=A0ABS8CDG3_9BURK|nr:penicillin acylase family protein [Mesopusillimonas faecipullorum]MCB5364033.1 penicillin acylase family protein [Mesopusillimonas faecipullorum]
MHSHPGKPHLLCATLLCTALLAACGGSSGDDSNASDPTDPPKASEITIKRDKYGTPHIYAEDTYSLFYGMGYAVAEDRLFQWEMIKRMARGTTAEALGADYIEADKAARKAYDAKTLQQQIDELPKADRDILVGWADGYNKRLQEVLAAPDSLMPKQFSDFGIAPTPISALDLVAAYFRGSLANFADSNSEVANLGLLSALQQRHGEQTGKNIFDQLRWKNDPASPTSIKESDITNVALGQPRQAGTSLASWTNDLATWAKTTVAALLPKGASQAPTKLVQRVSPEVINETLAAEMENYGGTGPDYFPRASNTWLLNGDRVEEGQAALYIGPQYGNNNPTNAFGVGLHGAGYNAVGTSHWGFPMIMWGANDKIGWGVTVGFGDTVDIFQLQINPNNPMQYRHNGGWRNLTKRTETISVKGADDVSVEFLSSHYGQIDSFDEAQGVAYARGRTWVGQEVSTLIAWSKMNKAQNWQEYLEQGSKIAASLNWYYVDADNNIGAAYLGAFVEKPSGHDFRLPLPGDGSADWLGALPFSKQPKVLNPESGEIINWNNKVSASWDNADYQFWGRAHHVNVINNAVNRKEKLTLEEFHETNEIVSHTEVNFNYFKPLLAEASQALAEGDPLKPVYEVLADWDGYSHPNAETGVYDSAAYTIFRTWLPKLVEAALRDDLPDAYWAQYRNASAASTSIGVNVALNALLGEEATVAQNYDFLNGESRNDVINRVMADSVQDLTARFGHATLNDWLSPLIPHTFGVRAIGGVTVNTADQAVSLPAEMARGTANHMVTFKGNQLDYADVIAPGQSGFVAPDGSASPHYQDQLKLYGDFKLKPGSLNDVQAVSTQTLNVER